MCLSAQNIVEWGLDQFANSSLSGAERFKSCPVRSIASISRGNLNNQSVRYEPRGLLSPPGRTTTRMFR